MKKQTKTKIRVGSAVKAKAGDLENITREGRIRSTRKEVARCVHIVVGEKKFLIPIRNMGRKKRYVLLHLCF